MRYLAKAVLLAAVVLFPALAHAQSLTGVVRDGSGGVLPGVTVEAASPALIEKVRTVVSDGSGQYRLENLPPGSYSVTYTLPGFSTVKRDVVELTTGVTVTLNTEMRVGGLQETITVTGETPVVDVQNSTRVQRVLDDEVVAALPASRGYGNLLATVSGIQANGTAEQRHRPRHDLLHLARRPQQRGHRADRRHERRLGLQRRRRGGLRLRHRRRPGSAGHGGRRSRRGRPRRACLQPGAQDRRQQLRRHLLRQPRRQVVAERQRRRRAAVVRHPQRGGHHPELGHQLLDGRADQARQGVVLRHGADVRLLHRHRRPLRQRQRGQSAALGLRGRSEHHAALGHQPQDRRRPCDRPALAEEQGQRLLRLSEGVRRQLVRRRRRVSAASAATTGSRWAASATGRRSPRTRATTPRRSCSSRTPRR